MIMVRTPKMLYQKAVVEILDSAKKSIQDKAQAENLFQFSGIEEEGAGNLTFLSFVGDPDACLKTLAEKLSRLPVVKISAIFAIETE